MEFELYEFKKNHSKIKKPFSVNFFLSFILHNFVFIEIKFKIE